MTILTKPGLIIKKTPLINETRCEEVTVDIHPPVVAVGRRPQTSAFAVLCMTIVIVMLVLLGLLASMKFSEQLGLTRHSHYQGYCSIPLARDLQMLESRKMALRLKEADDGLFARAEPDLQVLSVGEAPDMLDTLRELLDIRVDDSLERIAVYSGGRAVSFLHDFSDNLTGIVDSERCFVSELDPQLVLPPDVFVVGLRAGGQFDVGRVRSSLRAELPALPRGAARARSLPAACRGKPVYQLTADAAPAPTNGSGIRKRSASSAPPTYIHFAGRNVQELSISNMAELLQHEAALPPAAAA